MNPILQFGTSRFLQAHVDLFVREALASPTPLGEEDASRTYLAQIRDRFNNPYFAHRIADITQNHEEKKRRRFFPVITQARELGLDIKQPRLDDALGHAMQEIR